MGAGAVTYLVPHVHADWARLTRPLETLPAGTASETSQTRLRGGLVRPGRQPTAWRRLPPAPASEHRDDMEQGDGQRQPPRDQPRPGHHQPCLGLGPRKSQRGRDLGFYLKPLPVSPERWLPQKHREHGAWVHHTTSRTQQGKAGTKAAGQRPGHGALPVHQTPGREGRAPGTPNRRMGEGGGLQVHNQARTRDSRHLPHRPALAIAVTGREVTKPWLWMVTSLQQACDNQAKFTLRF